MGWFRDSIAKEQEELIYKCIGKSLFNAFEEDIDFKTLAKNDKLYINYIMLNISDKKLGKLSTNKITKEIKELWPKDTDNEDDLKQRLKEYFKNKENRPKLLLFFEKEDDEKKEIRYIQKIIYDTLYNRNYNLDNCLYKRKLDGNASYEIIRRFVFAYLSIDQRQFLTKYYIDYCKNKNKKIPLLTYKIKEKLENDFKEYIPENVDVSDFKSYESILEDAYKDYMMLIRKYLIYYGFEYAKMNLMVADEMQNYADIIEKVDGKGTDNQKNDALNEADWLVSKIIGGQKCPVLLMSATPFRYKTKQDKYENMEADDKNGSDNDKDVISVSSTRNRELDKEFQMITKYLLPDKNNGEYEEWYNEWNDKEIQKNSCITKGDFKSYKKAVAEQTDLMKKANIIRTERSMAGRKKDLRLFHTENFLITDGYADNDDSIYKIAEKELELQPRPKKKLPERIDDLDDIKEQDGTYYLALDAKQWYYYVIKKSGSEYEAKYIIDDPDYLYYLYDLDEDIFYPWLKYEPGKEPIPMNKDEVDYKLNREKWKWINNTEQLNKARRFGKSTPAIFSFSKDYKCLSELNDSMNNSKLSSERIEEHKALFAVGEQGEDKDKGLLYNARVKKLFDVVFGKEELHKLLFIPPAHPSKELSGVFKGKKGMSKRLFFTDYVMTAKSLSVVLSCEAERRNFEALNQKIDIENFSLPVVNDDKNKWFIDKDIFNQKGYTQDKIAIVNALYKFDQSQYERGCKNSSSPYAYAKSKNMDDSDTYSFCKAYYDYMTSPYAIHVLLAYAYDKENHQSLYDVIMEYGKSGCISDVFDEYLELANVSELKAALSVRVNEVKYNTENQKLPSIAWGHFSGDKLEKESAANTLENKIKRFKTPFWPFMFITTSIGGEGFDFDRYCRKIVHWCLAYNPLTFEQREGRINRYHSYAIRLILSELTKNEDVNTNWTWKRAFDKFSENTDSKGLAPDFVLTPEMLENSDDIWEKYGLVREFYYYPGSFEARELKNVLTSLGYYRALLGHKADDTYEDKLKEFLVKAEKEDQNFDINDYFVTLYPDDDKSREKDS